MKTFIEQLETAKAMIASHFKTKIAVGDKLENSMICAIAGVGNVPYVKNEMFCEFCKIKGHTSYKGGKPFCFKLIKKLKNDGTNNDNNNNNNDNNNNNNII